MVNQRKPKILIVDDVPTNIQVLGTLLAKLNCELAVAMNGKQALEVVERISPDLILLDVMMPVMNGHETCIELKSKESTRDIPVIFLSAKSESNDIVEGFKLGAVDYVTKPFIGKELLARVQTHLELKQAKQTLNEELQSKDKFFSIISHDLRGAFGIIMSFVDLIQNNREYLSDAEVDELLNDIANTSKNTLELLENLLQWARSQTGAIRYQPENLPLSVLLKDICEQHKHIAKAKDIELVTKSDNQHIVMADKNMIKLILRNLLVNALKYTNKNGRIELISDYQDDMIKVTVSDTGIGMEQQKIRNLFSLDTKVSTQGTANEQGYGLGLILTKEFIRINSGNIGVESQPGFGTKIWITLPKNYPDQ
ncbi:MAG: hybrid sensor histidine kinase/response regulator [Prolixibacteraceae bacterium]|nr:hybrid sensor histidine kinase/response regulator [Prolixibacteraceae bacterium]